MSIIPSILHFSRDSAVFCLYGKIVRTTEKVCIIFNTRGIAHDQKVSLTDPLRTGPALVIHFELVVELIVDILVISGRCF